MIASLPKSIVIKPIHSKEVLTVARLTIKEAVEISPVSESTLRRDIKSGKVSSEKDERGRRDRWGDKKDSILKTKYGKAIL